VVETDNDPDTLWEGGETQWCQQSPRWTCSSSPWPWSSRSRTGASWP